MLAWAIAPTLGQTNLMITSFSTAGSLVYTNVLPGHHYALQQTDELAVGWTNALPPLADIQTTGRTMTISVPVIAAQQFYRIADLGSCCSNTGGDSFSNPVYLGQAFADAAGGSFYRSGCGNAWFSALALDHPAINGGFLNAVMTLTSASGTDYDLYVYTSAGTLYRYSATRGLDRVSISIEDNPSIDDSRTWIIEVRRYLAYPCSDWQLTVSMGG